MTNLEGRIINGYHLDERLSHDQLADVYRAHKTDSSRRQVALKIVHNTGTGDIHFIERFMREMRILNELSHDNLIPVIEWGITEAQMPYLVSNYMGGLITLRDVLNRQTLTLADSWLIMQPISDVLGFIHENGVLHRDVKPSKIFIKDDDQAFHIYLGNFGLSKQLGLDKTVTRKGERIGTAAYISPETVREDPLDHRADLYSLAVVMYEVTLGVVPFQKVGRNTDQVAVAHALEDPPLPSFRQPDFPKPLEVVLMRGMAKQPADRYASARDFAIAYAEALDQIPQDVRQRHFWDG